MFAIISSLVFNASAEDFFTMVWLLTMSSIAIGTLFGWLAGEILVPEIPETKVTTYRKRRAPRLISKTVRFPEEAHVLEDVKTPVVSTENAEKAFFGFTVDTMLAYVAGPKVQVHPWAASGFAY